jgi:tetratricopeptide (TPR) repeat protein
MNELGEDARAILELARDAHDPDARDRARVRGELAARIGTAAGLGLAAGLGAAVKTTATAGAAAAGTGAGVAAGTVGASVAVVKLVSAALIVSATVGVGATVVHRARHAQLAPAAAARKVPARDTSRAEPAPPRAVAAAAAPVVPAPQPVARPRPVEPRAARAEAPALPAQRDPLLTVAEEARLVQAGVVALQSGRPARALDLFDAHARAYPHGVLAEERAAERALALADLGRREEARAAIDTFLQAHPDSPLAARLRARASRLDGAPAAGP